MGARQLEQPGEGPVKIGGLQWLLMLWPVVSGIPVSPPNDQLYCLHSLVPSYSCWQYCTFDPGPDHMVSNCWILINLSNTMPLTVSMFARHN
ncbi:hypothetical protein DFJ58DRAFT_806288, partial [Suillus subalutaceus]|uniref:uncharacterized protein n=1 Tax=Suillus subalutaceus TaxID=48586 RepID=UPI001B8763BF